MATFTNRLLDNDLLARTAPLIGVCTLALTAAFVGVVGLAAGEATGLVSRLPLYVLAGAVVFVGTLLVVDGVGVDGITTLLRAGVAGVVGFLFVALGSEGVIYAVTHPDAVVASHLFVYLLSAAIIASGLGYWAVNNRRAVRSIAGGRRL